MDWIHTLIWVARGRGGALLLLALFIAATYAFVPMRGDMPALVAAIEQSRDIDR